MSKASGDSNNWINNYTPLDLTNPATPHNRVLVVGETKFYVNAEHLSLCSEFFRTMFNSDFKEKNAEEIEIKEVEAEVFHAFLQLLHPRTASPVTKDNYALLVTLSQQYLARGAFAICEDFIMNNIKELDIVVLLKLAFEYKWDNLKEKLKEKMCSDGQTECCYCTNFYIGFLVDRYSSVIQNMERITALPTEIQAFILQVFMEKAKTP